MPEPDEAKSPLDEMAEKLVGDGKEPNLFFVSLREEGVVAVFALDEEAVDWAEDNDAYLIEDRQTGDFWVSEEYEADQEAEGGGDEEEEEEEEEEEKK